MYRGYFTAFSVNETAQSPGLFEYSFTFKVTRRTGVRQNFMPWHLDPTDADGKTKSASEPNINTDSFGNNADNKSIETSELCFGTSGYTTSESWSTESVSDSDDKSSDKDKYDGKEYKTRRGS
tara:strand:- start:287 stop:655 length:369 start_codon:yes stop_codon:yes gene_type:complete